jgi:hypothetical protein
MSGQTWMLRRLADGLRAVSSGREGQARARLEVRRPLAAAVVGWGGFGGGKSRLAACDGSFRREMMSP